jgi:hypothetical protein
MFAATYVKNTSKLMVSTPLKNISQIGIIIPTIGENKHVPNHQPGIHRSDITNNFRAHVSS